MKKINGLSNEEIKKQIELGNINSDIGNNLKSNGEIIKENVFTLFNLYNLIIAIALVSVKAYTNTFFFAIILMNVMIGILQEVHGRNLVKKLSILSTSKVAVIRNGKEEKINANEIVIGDVVVLDSGDQIPSDSVLIDGEVEVNEALLTGESDLILKEVNDKLFSGSFIVSGKCYAEVTKVGKENFANEIINAAKKPKAINSELINSMKKVTKFTSIFIIPIGIFLFIQAYAIRGSIFSDAVVATAAALLGMLPKGLVLLISIALESGVIKLAKKEVLVQDMYSIETLAHIDTICLDKTGTITQGKMRVSEVEILDDKCLPRELNDMMSAFVNASVENNATFMALKKYFDKDINYEKQDNISFSSERKWSSITFAKYGSIVIGAPEKLFEKSKTKMPQSIYELQNKGKRVLAVGYVKAPISEPILPSLKIVAIIILEDPLRKNAKEMLGYFKEQGLDVKVISGDNALTVSKVAEKAGLENYNSYIDLSTIKSDDEIFDLVDKYSIFARVLPNQKSLIVKALQAKGHKVAMTGDGVNDVIALRESDCSITFPDATESAKQVSQIVLLNSDFSVLKDVLMEGRRVVNNITNVSRIFFIKTIYSVLLSIICIILNMQFPFIPIQITLIDLAIEAYTSFFITLENNKKKIKGKFLNTALTNALPFALTIILNVLILTILNTKLGIDANILKTMMYLMIGFVSILAVEEVCMPFNKIHAFLFSTTAIGFYTAVVLFKNILKITLPNFNELIIIFILMILSYLLIVIKRKIYKKYFAF